MPWYCFWWSVVVIGRAARDTALHPTLMPVAEHLQWACTSKFEYLTTPFAQHAATGTVSLLGGNEGGLTLSKEAIEVVLRSVHFYFDHYGAHPNSKLWSRLPAAKATPKLKLVLDMVIAVSGNVCSLQFSSSTISSCFCGRVIKLCRATRSYSAVVL